MIAKHTKTRLAVATALLLSAAGCADSGTSAADGATTPSRNPTPSGASPSVSSSSSASAPASPVGNPLPELLYRHVDVARVLLEGLKVELKVVQTTTTEFLPGTVVSQTPKPGALVKAGQVVTVTTADPPACDPSYPTLCIAPFGPDVRCHDLRPNKGFEVLPPDRHRLDPDHDGVGCED